MDRVWIMYFFKNRKNSDHGSHLDHDFGSLWIIHFLTSKKCFYDFQIQKYYQKLLNRELNLKDNGFFTSAVITNEFVDFAIKIWMSAVNTGKFKLPDEAAPQQAAPAAVQEDAEVQEIDNQEVQVGVRCETCRQVKQDCRECPGVGNQRCPNKIKQCEACRNSNGYDFCFACALKNQN